MSKQSEVAEAVLCDRVFSTLFGEKPCDLKFYRAFLVVTKDSRGNIRPVSIFIEPDRARSLQRDLMGMHLFKSVRIYPLEIPRYYFNERSM